MKKHANIAFFVPHAGCPHSCSFCDQKAISGSAKAPSPEEITKTLADARKRMGERAARAEIAFFGGSFTAIAPALRRSLLDAAAPFVGQGGFSGIRISTRPDAIDSGILRELKGYGVTAIELGAQSMDDRVLALAERGHTARDVEEASRLIREHGFSLGLQMMTGLLGDTDDTAMQTAERLADLQPDTMRIYPALTLVGTRLEQLYRAGEYMPQTLEEATGLCVELLLFFEERGIRVIRLGLHQSESMMGSVIAGPHHPAFRELAEGKILLDRVLHELNRQQIPPGKIEIKVAIGSESKMAGQNRRNLAYLSEMGYHAAIRADEILPYLHTQVTKI